MSALGALGIKAEYISFTWATYFVPRVETGLCYTLVMATEPSSQGQPATLARLAAPLSLEPQTGLSRWGHSPGAPSSTALTKSVRGM